jgi:hypothetical protein
VRSAAVNLDPPRYLAGWRAEVGTLFLPVLSEAELGEEVAVRVRLRGHPFRATLFGSVGLVRRVGRLSLPPGVELRLDPQSRRTAGWLAEAAHGRDLSFRERAPRFVASRPLVVVRDRVASPLATTNVSTTGCAIRWDARPLPATGDALGLRLGAGLLAASAEAIVAWIDAAARGQARVGLRVVTNGRAARLWARIAADAAQSGACLV